MDELFQVYLSDNKNNGLELIEQVRKENLNCKFIIISGYRQFEYAHKALKNNVDDYLLYISIILRSRGSRVGSSMIRRFISGW